MSEQIPHSVFSQRARQREEARDVISAMLAGLNDRVRVLLAEAFQRSGSLEYVSHLADAARQETQDMWYKGELGLVEEQQMLRDLEWAVGELARSMPGPPPAVRRCILTATDEVRGSINQRLLEEDGWSVTRVDLRSVVAETEGMLGMARRLVVIVGNAGMATPALRSTIPALHALGSRVLVVVPGQWAQAGRWHQLGSDAWAGDARTMLLLARKLYSTDTTFSIREVAATLGVTSHTVRAWERRYRLPAPARDGGGQRRYSADDVQLLMRISHAATVHGHSLKLAALEAQGLITPEVADVVDPDGGPAVGPTLPNAQPWRRIADAFPELLMLVDAEGIILDCNVATARAWGMLRESFRGMRFTDLVVDYDRAKAMRLYRPSPRRRDAWELRMRSRVPEQIVAAFDSRVLVAGEARLLGLIGRMVSEGGSASQAIA